MEHISKIVPSFNLNLGVEEDEPLDPKAVETVNKLFVFFYGTCRGFEKQYQDPRKLNIEKTQWFRVFTDEKLTDMTRVNWGIKRCRIESPINTPTLGQFLKWCEPTPEQLGVPDVEKAYTEAVQNSYPGCEKKWTHQAIYHAWKMCNTFDLSNLPKKSTFPVFERNYEITIRMLARNEPLAEIPLGLTHNTEAPKQQKASEGFEEFNSYEKAMPYLRKKLGIKEYGSTAHG